MRERREFEKTFSRLLPSLTFLRVRLSPRIAVYSCHIFIDCMNLHNGSLHPGALCRCSVSADLVPVRSWELNEDGHRPSMATCSEQEGYKTEQGLPLGIDAAKQH